MTPKEKAEQLVNQYEICTRPLFALGNYENEKHYNKQCALLVVAEILNNDNNLFNTYLQNDYWLQVKQEIENL